MKKKIVCLLLVTTLTIALAACGTSDQNKTGTPADSTKEKTQDENPKDDPDETVEPEELVVYYLNEEKDGLESQEVSLDEITVDSIIETLEKYELIPEELTVNSFADEIEDSYYTLTLDVSSEFQSFLDAKDTEEQKLIMQAITNTLLKLYEADRFQLTVAGEALTTEANAFTEYLTYAEITDNTPASDENENSDSSDDDTTE